MKTEILKNMARMGGYLWQSNNNRCYLCAQEGKVCQYPSNSEIVGVWEILLRENSRAVLNSARSEEQAIEKCVVRVGILNRELAPV